MASDTLPTSITEEERSTLDTYLWNNRPFASYSAVFGNASAMQPKELNACLELIASTSAAAYKASSKGWSAADKWAEMQEEGMRYILLRRGGRSDKLSAFLSYLPTTEHDPDVDPSDFPVLYIYEVHVHPSQQSRGIGRTLMGLAEALAVTLGVKKTMLTVFTSNEAGLRFYDRLGYEKWDEEVVADTTRRLRSGNVAKPKPSFIILAKDVENDKH